MNLDAIHRIAEANMKSRRFHLEREPGYVYYHGQRVGKLAGRILRLVEGIESDPIMSAGALFHDIGKGFESHHNSGADIVINLLEGACSVDEIEGIQRVVRFHCVRKQGLDLEDRVLAVQDADLIDHLGTQEIWLNFLHAAYHDSTQQSVVDWWRSDTFQHHISEMRRLVNFDVARELLEERIAYHQGFLKRFACEAEGGIPEDVLSAIGNDV